MDQTYKGGSICFGKFRVVIPMIQNENGELVRDPDVPHVVLCCDGWGPNDGSCVCCGPADYKENSTTAPIQQQPQSHPVPFINPVTPQYQTPAAPFVQGTPQEIPDFAPPAYAPQQIEIPMAQMQDWSTQQSSGGYNHGPV